jgi:hypothetical protein
VSVDMLSVVLPSVVAPKLSVSLFSLSLRY